MRNPCVALTLSALLASGCSSQAEQPPVPPESPANDWMQLFDGESLAGWTPKIRGYEVGDNFGDTFRVEDGLLSVGYENYGGSFDGRFGHLFYDEPFGDYVVRVEYRFVGEQLPDGPGWAYRNSGIMVHGQRPESMGLEQDFPVSIEVQLLGGGGEGERTTANLCTPGTNVVMGGELVTRHCTDSTSETYHGDQWVTVEVEVRSGELIDHRIDGVSVLAYTDPQLDERDPDAQELLADGQPLHLESGTISLQSESHPIQFRSVELKLLD